MLMQNTRESALRREEFHEVLKAWLDDSFDDRATDADSHAGTAWLWVRHGGAHFYLAATSTRSGIRAYIRLVDSAAGNPDWSALPTGDPTRERVAFDRDGLTIDGFDFYEYMPQR